MWQRSGLLGLLCAAASLPGYAQELDSCQKCLRDRCPKVQPCLTGLLRDAGRSDLYAAVAKGQLAQVQYWIETAGFSVDEVMSRYNDTPLSIAAYFGGPGSIDVARYLIDRGAHVNQALGGAARSPLLTAIWKHNQPVAQLLLARGADTTVRSDRGYDACIFAHRWSNFAIMPALTGCCERILAMPPDPSLPEASMRPAALLQACQATHK